MLADGGALIRYFSRTNLDYSLEAGRRRVYVVDIWEASVARSIKANDPSAIVLAYKDASAVLVNSSTVVNGADGLLLPAGVGYVDADRNHGDWFLLDGAGTRLTFEDYPGNWQMDTGNPAYQRRWAENVVADLERQAVFDGVMMDDALTRAKAHHESRVPAKYPTDAAMQAATRSMIAAVAPAVRAAGFVTYVNIPGAYEYPGLFSDWLSLIDGAVEENFAVWGASYVSDWGGNGWRAHIAEINEAARQNKTVIFRAGANNADRAGIRYALASYLVADYSSSVFTAGNTVEWFPEYDWRIGMPSSSATEIEQSVFRRDFTLGMVLVNAHASKTVTVQLGRTLRDENGNIVSTVTVGPTQGRILRAA